MVKKNAKHEKSNHTKPQSSKTSVTMEEDKTSATVVQETELGNKKLLRHQEKIKREEEELKKLQADKEKAETAERSKKTSKKKPKNTEKNPSVVKMTENIPVVTNEETPEKLPEMPSENLVENESPPIKTLFVRPGTDQEWAETPDTQLSEDWNELIRKDEEPITDDQKIQKQTDFVSYDVQDGNFPSTENLNQWSEHQNDREPNYRGKNNQVPKSIGRLEYRRGGGGNIHNNDNNPRKRNDFGGRGEHSNSNRYNKSFGARGGSRGHDRPSSFNEYQDCRNYDQTPNAEYSYDKKGFRNDRPPSSNESRNVEYTSFDKRGPRNDRPPSSNESGNSNKCYSRGGRGNRNHRPSSSNEYSDYRNYDHRPSSSEVQNYGHSNRGSRGGNRNIESQHFEGKQHDSPRHSPNQNQFRERKDSGESSNAKSNYNRGNRQDSNQDDNYSNRPPSRSNNYKTNYRNQSYNKKNADESNPPRFNQNRRNFNYNRRGPNNHSQSFGDSNWSGSMGPSKQQATSDDWGAPQNNETHDWADNSSNWANLEAAPFEETAGNVSDANAVSAEEAMDVNVDESHHYDQSMGKSNQSKKSYKMEMQSSKEDDSYRHPVYKNKQYSSNRNDLENWRTSEDRRDANKRSGDDRRDGNKRSGGDKRDNRKRGDRSDGDRRNIDVDKEYDEIMRADIINHGKLSEKIGDLFKAPANFSLAHCVAADLAMGAGIAVHFRNIFRRVSELLNQNQRTGGLAVIEDNDRFIYYLITKERSNQKPSHYTLWQSLLKLKEHCVKHEVTNLAIPQIGCGLDKLNWDNVKNMLEHIFRDVDINIVVYLLKEAEESPRKPAKGFVTHTKILLTDIESQTGLLYFGAEDAGNNPEIDSLAEKHDFLHAYKSAPKTAGSVVKTVVGKEYIYGLIVRKTTNDKFDFVVLEKSLRELRKILKQDKTEYIGFQAFKDDDSTLIVDKILSLMQYLLVGLEIWVCWPPELEEHCPFYQ